jgi:hypothetical protein
LEKYPDAKSSDEEIQYLLTNLEYKKLSIYLRFMRTDGITTESAMTLLNKLKETEDWYIEYTDNLRNNYGVQ